MVGEPQYMAPERISGQGYGFGVDNWSLGILLFAMLHTETPFAKDTTETQVQTSIGAVALRYLPRDCVRCSPYCSSLSSFGRTEPEFRVRCHVYAAITCTVRSFVFPLDTNAL